MWYDVTFLVCCEKKVSYRFLYKVWFLLSSNHASELTVWFSNVISFFQFSDIVVYEPAISIRNNCHKGFYIGFIGFPITIAIKCQCNSFQNTLYNSVIQPVIQPVSYVGGQEALGRKNSSIQKLVRSSSRFEFQIGHSN